MSESDWAGQSGVPVPRDNAYVVGFDFGAPRQSRDQRKKIVGLWAECVGERKYRVAASGPNARVAGTRPGNPLSPGWTAAELIEELTTAPVAVVAFDFPFSLPQGLLADASFAALIGVQGSIASSDPTVAAWDSYAAAISQRLPLGDPLDFSPFAQWRAKQFWRKRDTDIVANAQPPLKHVGQNMFQMTLLGAVVLQRLRQFGYSICPFDAIGLTDPAVIEVYPGNALRTLGVNPSKGRPEAAVHALLHRLAEERIDLTVEAALLNRIVTYATGSGDYDLADAFVALGTALLHAHGATRRLYVTAAAASIEGLIWTPRSGLD